MQFHTYRFETPDGGHEIIAIRHHWGKEHKIYEAVQNACVIKLMDHLFLFPLTLPSSFIPSRPNVIIDGVLHEFDESCQLCKHRLQKVTSDCPTCVFSPLQPLSDNGFSRDGLYAFLQEEAAPIDILSLMAKHDIYQLYFLYHFKPFYENELLITRTQFIRFIEQFDANILFQNEKEIIIKKNDFYYETTFQKGYVEEKMNQTDLEGLKLVYDTIRNRMDTLKEKEALLRRIIGEAT